MTVTLRESLSGKALLLTGASGFVGKAVLAQCLHELPETTVTVLLRGDAEQRLRQLLEGDIFEGLDGSAVKAISGDLAEDVTGVAGIDVLIHCAASVSFEQPLDDALELNSKGPARLLRALRAAGSDPYVVHVSTAYAAGQRSGLVLERPSGTAPSEPAPGPRRRAGGRGPVAHGPRVRVAPAACTRTASSPRRAAPSARPAGRRSAPARSRCAGWVREQLTERGRDRARALGWTDTYGLSKALGERLLIAEQPKALSIVRPAIIESALRTPYPGWLESIKVADPIFLAYGSGLIAGRFTANRSITVDIVPVDMVANACLAAAGHEPDGPIRTLNMGSSSRNPLTIEALSGLADALLPRAPAARRGRAAGRRAGLASLQRRPRHDHDRPRHEAARHRPRSRRQGPAAARRRHRAQAAQDAAAARPRSAG